MEYFAIGFLLFVIFFTLIASSFLLINDKGDDGIVKKVCKVLFNTACCAFFGTTIIKMVIELVLKA